LEKENMVKKCQAIARKPNGESCPFTLWFHDGRQWMIHSAGTDREDSPDACGAEAVWQCPDNRFYLCAAHRKEYESAARHLDWTGMPPKGAAVIGSPANKGAA
jgi:hypothetical protein